MRTSLLRRGLQLGLLGGVVASSMLSMSPAGADLPSGTVAVAAGGSDTTELIMKDYLAAQTTSNDGNTTYNVKAYNIPAFPVGTYDVENDGQCNAVAGAPGYTGGTIHWASTGAQSPPKAPSGSGAGRNFLLTQRSVNGQTVACLDIARSSSKGSELGLEYYAFALDAVAWASPSLKAPAYLTKAQVQAIYACTITDWSQVGGVPGKIQRYLPQSGSGTLATFQSEWLNNVTPASGQAANGCPDVKQVDKNGNPFEENQGKTIADVDMDKAILPYSAAVWIYQKNNSINPTLDKRNNVQIRGLQTAPTSGSPVVANPVRWNVTNGSYEQDFVNGTNPNGVVSDDNVILTNGGFNKDTGYAGIRFVFNVVDTQNPISYGPAVGLVGFQNTSNPSFKSPLCDGSARGDLLAYGFAPLPTNAGGNRNLAASSCRKF